MSSLRRKARPHWRRIKILLEQKFLKPSDKVVLFNTGSGLKYIDVIADALGIQAG